VSIAFLLTTLVVVVTPGTGVIYTLSAGLSHGRRAGVLAALACTVGMVPHVLATITGFAALLRTSEVAFDVVKYLGVAYLLYVALVTLRDRGALAVDEDSTPGSTCGVITSGILINLLNPKLTMFFVAFLPQFVSAGDPAYPARMLELSAVAMALTFVVFAVYGAAAGSLRNLVISRPRVLVWLRRIFAGSFLALGVRLALTQP
jgi:threonine/homoserine/homoserine lactone efflux protein